LHALTPFASVIGAKVSTQTNYTFVIGPQSYLMIDLLNGIFARLEVGD